MNNLRECVIDLDNASQEKLDRLRTLFEELGEPVYKTEGIYAPGVGANAKFFPFSNTWGTSHDAPNITLDEFLEKFGILPSLRFKRGDMVRFKDSMSRDTLYFAKGLEYLEIRTLLPDPEKAYALSELDKSTSWYVQEEELEAQPLRTIPKVGFDYAEHFADLVVWVETKVEHAQAKLFNLIPAEHKYGGDFYVFNEGGVWRRTNTPTTEQREKSVTFEEAKEQFLGQANELFDHELAILYSSDEEEQEAVTLGVKEVVIASDTSFRLGIHRGGTLEYNRLENIDREYIAWPDLKAQILEKEKRMTHNTSHNHKVIVEPEGPAELTLWKNPRPSKPNEREIRVGQRVLIDGQTLNQTITRTTKKLAYVGSKRYKKVDVYPIYKLSNPSNIAVGDIYMNPHTATLEVNVDKLPYDPPEAWSTKPEVLQYDRYSCGSILLNGDKFDDIDALQEVFPEAKLKAHVHKISYTHIEIAAHYELQESEVVEKNSTIAARLDVTLDHPINVADKEWALIYGPSGTGKTTAAIDYAKRKNMEYIKLQGSAQVTVDDLVGYKSITTGEYFPSLLRDAVENGKVFILDEMDACNPNTMLALNGLKQEMYQFPDKLVKVHEDFRFIATANTLEYDEQYNARSPMDKATRVRFDAIEYTMEDYELALRYGLKYIRKIKNIDRLTAREVSRAVNKLMILEEAANDEVV